MASDSFQPGERILLHDRAGRRYAIDLAVGGTSSLHSGLVRHDELIGRPEGVLVQTSGGARLLALRPTFAERVVFGRRSAQPIYPKDLGAVLVLGDVRPGMTVLEAGTGTGALAIVLARAVGSEGRVISYEVREEFQARARATISGVFGSWPPQLELRLGDVRESTDVRADRVCLDLPEPWAAVSAAAQALRPGGILFALCPNVSQVQRFVEALREQKGFGLTETIELLQRGWAVRERSLRPMHRMVAHTGFLVFARRLAEAVFFETESEGYC